MRLGRVRASQRRILAGIVDLLLPAAPQLEPEVHRRVAEYTTCFVVTEVENIPTFLRLPYVLAIRGFQWLAVARYGRPFSRLGAEKRQAYLTLWSYSPIGVMRDFVKLIRGCALLAYFDHPEVRDVLERVRAGHLALRDEHLRVAAE